MPKRKQFLGVDKKKGKQAAVLPTTADEYLSAGVDLQEAGEKWRGGDAIKSIRFFTKALETYEEGLSKFPTAFDIAYNKAQIQYQFTQYPKLLEKLPVSLLELLQTALQSSRYALSLNGDNADVLFNTAQVLGSLAEAVISNPGSIDVQPVQLLEEALIIFQRCLGIQEAAYAASLKQIQSDTAMEDTGITPSSASNESDFTMGSTTDPSIPSPSTEQVMQEEQWVTIIEQTTSETLIDTMTAQLEILIMLCEMVNDGSGIDLGFIQKYGADILLPTKLPALLAGVTSDIAIPAAITIANFNTALADASYNTGRITYDVYWNLLDGYWPKSDFSQDFSGLVSLAESMITFNDSVRTRSVAHGGPPELLTRWQALSRAQDSLTQATKLPATPSLEKVHLLRGNVDILRYQVGQYENVSPSEAIRSGPVLCRNAEIYYRGSRKEASDPSVGNQAVALEAAVKEGLARQFGGQANALRDAAREIPAEQVRAVLQDALEGGIVLRNQLEQMGVEL